MRNLIYHAGLQVHKNVYDVEFKEEVTFDVVDAGSTMQPILVELFNWNAVGKSRRVGATTISAEEVARVASTDPGWTGVATLSLIEGNTAVMGHDKKICEITLRFSTLASSGGAELPVGEKTTLMRGLDPPPPTKRATSNRLLHITIAAVNHLPKIHVLGKCDPFCEVVFGGVTQATQVVKGVFDATWAEPMAFEMDAGHGAGELLLRILTWKGMGGPAAVGEVRLPGELMTRVVRADTGWVAEAKFEIRKDEAPVVGKDKQRCTLTVRLAVLDGQRGLDPPEPLDDPLLEPRRLEVQVLSVRHLPKMDFLGSCDPFCRVSLAGHTQETSVKKNRYDAEWDEPFIFDINPTLDGAGNGDVLLVEVLDWDAGSAPEEIGVAEVPAEMVGRMARTNLGWSGEASFVLRQRGKAVVGKDGQTCIVTLRAMIRAGPKLLDPSESSQESSGATRLEIRVGLLTHLPKMDTFGSCDPHVELSFAKQTFTTKVHKNTLDVDFGEAFIFDMSAPVCQPEELGGLIVKVLDWNRTGAPDEIGQARFPAELMARVARAPAGWSQTISPEVCGADGWPVVGQDRQRCNITLFIAAIRCLSGIDPPKTQTPVSGPRRIQVKTENSTNLSFEKWCDRLHALSDVSK